MYKSFRDRWTAALRSGDYKQGREMLKTPEGHYCCLGVGLLIEGSTDLDELPEDLNESDSSDGAVEEYLRISSDQATALATMNDKGATFKYIADKIEEMFPDSECEEEEVEAPS